SSHRTAWAGLEAAGRQSAMPTIRLSQASLSGLADHFRLLGRRASGDAALGFEDDFLATDELVVVEAEAAALAVGLVDGVGDAFALPLAAVHLDDGVEGHGLAVGAGDDVAVGAHALAVLERDPADEGQAKGEQDAADAALAGEVAGAAVL